MLRLFILLIVIVATEGINQSSETCKPMNCEGKIKKCPYGYQKVNNCEICKCYDPCNPPGKAVLCGANKRCFIDKTSDGTFTTRCDSVGSKDVCEQEKVVGLCKAAFRRFYYDSITKKCEEFIYGGCRGNENNFESREQCEATCLN